jgi:hypothetical protein
MAYHKYRHSFNFSFSWSGMSVVKRGPENEYQLPSTVKINRHLSDAMDGTVFDPGIIWHYDCRIHADFVEGYRQGIGHIAKSAALEYPGHFAGHE